MLVSLWAPDALGRVRICPVTISGARRMRTSTGVWGAFQLDVLRVGQFPECRLLRRKDGAFFTAGEWLLDAGERRYLQFVEFLKPWSSWLAQAVRLEIVGRLREDDEEITPEDELLLLNDVDDAEIFQALDLDAETSIRIECPPTSEPKVTPKQQFHVVLGEAIRVKGCRIAGKRGRSRLILPTSEGLSLRPIHLEPYIRFEIARRAESGGVKPDSSVA